ncbi:MAG: hypothetical protein KDB72_20960 [Mycobacterium sp.]|nr:hypothetical protein [Mycobacterium sp.]
MADYVLFKDQIVDLSEATSSLVAALWELYEGHNARRGRMPLWCTKAHGGQMYLRKIDDRLWAAHYPGQGDSMCRVAVRHESEGAAHRHMKGYARRALESAGYAVSEEYSTGQTRLDLAVEAPSRFGIEAQFSSIVERDAKSRTTKSFRAGWLPIWLPATQGIADSIGYTVPALRHNDTDVDWESGVPIKGTVTATSVRRITAQRCVVSGVFDCCPDPTSGRRFCGQWHPWFNDMDAGWFTLDEALTGLGSGALVVHQDQRGTVRVVPSEDIELYRGLTGSDGEYSPGRKRPRPQDDDSHRECESERKTDLAGPDELPWGPYVPPDPALVEKGRQVAERIRVGTLPAGRCQECGKVTHHPDSLRSSLCRGCDLKMTAQARKLGLVV